MLQAVSGHLHISSGEIFRALPRDSKLGRIYRGYMDKGELGPDDLTVEIFCEHMESLVKDGLYNPEQQILFLDGIPRTSSQVGLLLPHLDLLQVLVFDMGDQNALVERLKKRALIEGRKDDQEIAILKSRMQIFEKQTLPSLKLFSKEQVIHIEADQKPLLVLRSILDRIGTVLA